MKTIIFLSISITFALFTTNAFASTKICINGDCYYYSSHWMSDEAWGDAVSDFSNADRIYCNVNCPFVDNLDPIIFTPIIV